MEAVKTDRSPLEDGKTDLPFVCGILLRPGVLTSSNIGLLYNMSEVKRRTEKRD